MADRPAPTSSTAAWSLAALVAGYLLVELVGAATASPLVPVLPKGVRVHPTADRKSRRGTPGKATPQSKP